MPANDTCGSLGTYTKFLVENSITTDPCPPATFDGDSERYEILSENIQYSDITVGGRGMTGTLDPIATHLRNGARLVFGRVAMEVGPIQLTNWLPRILGNDAAGTTFATDVTFDMNPFDIMLKRDAGTVIYRHCGVNRCLLRGRNGGGSGDDPEQTMQMILDIVGFEEHDATYPATEPALPASDELYWIIADGALTLDTPADDTEYYFDAFNLLINNNLTPKNWNFLSTTCIQSRGRDIRLQVSTPYTSDSHTNLYINRFQGEGVLNFLGTKNLGGTAQSPYQTTMTFPNLRQTRRTPATRGPGDIPLSLDLKAYRTSSEEPLTIVNTDS